MIELTELNFEVMGFISRPVAEVFEAVADPEQLSRYFTTGGAQGRLESGSTVTWDFADFPGAFPVDVLDAEPERRLTLRWKGESAIGEEGVTIVTFEFDPVDDGARTKVTISEGDWEATESGAKAAFGNSMGWTGMLAAMKAWLEHGVNLREGFYK